MLRGVQDGRIDSLCGSLVLYSFSVKAQCRFCLHTRTQLFLKWFHKATKCFSFYFCARQSYRSDFTVFFLCRLEVLIAHIIQTQPTKSRTPSFLLTLWLAHTTHTHARMMQFETRLSWSEENNRMVLGSLSFGILWRSCASLWSLNRKRTMKDRRNKQTCDTLLLFLSLSVLLISQFLRSITRHTLRWSQGMKDGKTWEGKGGMTGVFCTEGFVLFMWEESVPLLLVYYHDQFLSKQGSNTHTHIL